MSYYKKTQAIQVQDQTQILDQVMQALPQVSFTQNEIALIVADFIE